MYSYDTVSGAIEGLKSRGFSLDFNLRENCLVCKEHNLNVDDFEIVEVHRFEGNSDPADEAVVYAVQSNDGLKGVLVVGYGIYTDDNDRSEAMLKKLQIHRT